MKIIIQTAFYVSLLSYGAFVLADYVRPGFVSYVFSVHLFLIPIIAFGVWLAAMNDAEHASGSRVLGITVKVVFSLVLFVLFWREGDVFGDLRLVVVACGFALPWIASGLAGRPALGQDEDI